MDLAAIAKAAAARGETDIAWALMRIAGIEPEIEETASVVQSDDGPMYEKEYKEYAERYKERHEGEEAYVEIQDQGEVLKKKIKKEGPIVAPESIQGKEE